MGAKNVLVAEVIEVIWIPNNIPIQIHISYSIFKTRIKLSGGYVIDVNESVVEIMEFICFR